MSEPFEPDVEDGAPRYLVGVRLREPLPTTTRPPIRTCTSGTW